MLAASFLSALLAAGIQIPPSPRSEKAEREVPQIGVESALVELDVVVTDGKDHPVTDLGPGDFEVLEDGRPQAITHFAPGFGARSGGAASAAGQTTSPAPFPDEPGPRLRHVVLAVDDYHLEPEDLSAVKTALLRFIDGQLAAGDQVVVVAASGSLGPLQQFTSDRDVLRRAVARLRTQDRAFRISLDVPRMTEYQAELIEAGDQEALALAVDEIMATEPLSRQTINNRTRLEQQVRVLARQVAASTAHVTSLTLASLERLVGGLLPLHGRKVVALFSGGFFLGSDRRTSRRDLEVIAESAARSGVVVYTIDARGLVATPAIGDARVGGGYNITSSPGVRERIELRARDAARDGPNAIAADTGGLSFFDRNDLSGSLRRVLEDSAHYYRLGFEPEVSPRDGRFHRLEVRVRGRAGLRVRASSGYFSRVAAPAAAGEPAPPTAEEASRLLRTALDSSYPLRALPVDLSAEFVATDVGDVLVTAACLDAGRLPFAPTGDGHEAAAFELVGVVVDEEGKSVSQFSDRVELSLTPEAKERALRNGLTYRKTLAVRPGFLQARIAVRADGSGNLGSASQWVEVPDLSRAALALSSILVLAEGEDGGAAPPTARGTLSFDRARRAEVSRRFSRDGHLDYLLVVYGRRKPGTASPLEVDVETQLLSGNSILTRSPRHPVSAEGPAGLPVVTGRLRLDSLAPGDYELRLVVSNRSASASASRSLRFTVE